MSDNVSKFNATTDKVEWARWTWNPITGCLNDCDYCYARDIAARFYDHGFAPTFHPKRLRAPFNTSYPKDAKTNIGARNVFLVSMGDMLGSWVEEDWIRKVLEVCDNARQWNFLVLTKNPKRAAQVEWPPNLWVGTTVDCQARVRAAEEAFADVQATVKWLSCEPLRERLTFSRLDLFQWVVLGGASRSTRTPEFLPPREWVEALEAQARAAGCMVYEKPNLFPKGAADGRIREYPTVCIEEPAGPSQGGAA